MSEHPAITEAYAELCAWLRALGEPQGDDAADVIERLRADLEQMTRQANAVIESLHILSTSNRPRHGKH